MPASSVEVRVPVHYDHPSLLESGTKPRHFENPSAPVAVYKIPIYIPDLSQGRNDVIWKILAHQIYKLHVLSACLNKKKTPPFGVSAPI